jgi:hypothetical protein
VPLLLVLVFGVPEGTLALDAKVALYNTGGVAEFSSLVLAETAWTAELLIFFGVLPFAAACAFELLANNMQAKKMLAINKDLMLCVRQVGVLNSFIDQIDFWVAKFGYKKY